MQFFDELLGFLEKAITKLLLRADQPFDGRLPLRVLLVKRVHRGAADDERRAGFINENRVHFIHDGEVMAALDLLLLAERHAVVAQIIEAEFRIRAVGDVTVILFAANLG